MQAAHLSKTFMSIYEIKRHLIPEK